jgi:hypothetical protein
MVWFLNLISMGVSDKTWYVKEPLLTTNTVHGFPDAAMTTERQTPFFTA